MEENSNRIDDLRKQAERILDHDGTELPDIPFDDMKSLIYELRVHQIELEMQNEELRSAQLELSASRDRLSDLYDFAPVGYLTMSKKGVILKANLTFAIILGWDKLDILNKPLSRFIFSEDQDTLYKTYNQLIKSHDPQDCVLRMFRKDETIFWAHLECVIAKAKQADLDNIWITVSDISEQVKSEEERAQLMREIEFKNQEMEALVYTVSRELQSPLISVDGFMTMLLKEGNLSDKEKHFQNRIRANLSRMINLVSELLEYSRGGRIVGELTEIDVNVVIDEILEEMEEVLKGVKINVQKQLLHPASNRLRIYQIFSNLIDNAIKYQSSERDSLIQIRSKEMENMIHFQIQDNGIGIAKRHFNKIFVPYYRIDSKIQGVGIGLWIVKKVIEMHGGKIWVESEIDKGATMNFTLPKSKS